jgi:hypothetical protein
MLIRDRIHVMRPVAWFLAVAALLISRGSVWASGAASENYVLSDDVIVSSGGATSSESFQLTGTVGQVSARGESRSETYVLMDGAESE